MGITSDAADGYLGDWITHRESCRCTECQLERAEREIRRLKSDHSERERELVRLLEVAREYVEWCAKRDGWIKKDGTDLQAIDAALSKVRQQ